ncbi:MAG: hypothetical protein WAX89_01215 [Alphaproteobacteria bacterium]
MIWVAISGSWRISTAPENDPVRVEVNNAVVTATEILLKYGHGIVTGGALGVDFWATEKAMSCNSCGSPALKIILPTSLEIFLAHHDARAAEGKITVAAAQALRELLVAVKLAVPPARFIEMAHTVCTTHTLYDRNTQVVTQADALLAFQVNGTGGTQDAIDKAHAQDKPTRVVAFAHPTLHQRASLVPPS